MSNSFYIIDTRNANKDQIKLTESKTKLFILGILTTPFSPFNPKATEPIGYKSSSGHHKRRGFIYGTIIVQATICSSKKFKKRKY